MGFSDLKSDQGLAHLNSYLEDKSYIEGYAPSQADVAVYEAMSGAPDASKYENAARWYAHITSYKAEFGSLAGEKKDASSYGGDAPKAAADEDDDDIDLFGDDDEDDEEAERVKAERIKAYQEKKSKKPAVVAKSLITIDVKPWDDETDLAQLEKNVRAIESDGLVWGSSKFVEIGFGIKKLVITCVVEDAKVGVDFLQENIESDEDHVQSTDIAAFQKL
eukprot:Clim_evm13s11 gene=Clim_evmTU13s11